MVLTVTLNPLLERRLFFNEIKTGAENRTGIETYSAGGKGINVSRQLNCLNINNLAFTCLGGNNGKILKGILSDEKINFTCSQTKSETRSAVLVIEEDPYKVTTFFGPNSVMLESEVSEFKLRLKKMIENCEIVVFSGSSPCPEADSIFPYGIEVANEFDKISICDTYGNHLKACLEKSPTIIHNNVSEIIKSFNVSLGNEENIIDYLHMLYGNGIKQAYITDGPKTMYAANFDFIYKASSPVIKEVDSTGSGDAFTAGLAYGLHNSLTFEETLVTAISFGTANAAKADVCNISFNEISNYKEQVRIETVGKKMKPVE
jgi:1-phosphofructokinase family hexose kinase